MKSTCLVSNDIFFLSLQCYQCHRHILSLQRHQHFRTHCFAVLLSTLSSTFCCSCVTDSSNTVLLMQWYLFTSSPHHWTSPPSLQSLLHASWHIVAIHQRCQYLRHCFSVLVTFNNGEKDNIHGNGSYTVCDVGNI